MRDFEQRGYTMETSFFRLMWTALALTILALILIALTVQA
jgi:hypothetical protein